MEKWPSISIFIEGPIYHGADHVYDASFRIILKHAIDDNCEASGIAQVVRTAHPNTEHLGSILSNRPHRYS